MPIEVDGAFISVEKSNEIIQEIISCLRDEGLTYGQAQFLLDEAKAELSKMKIT